MSARGSGKRAAGALLRGGARLVPHRRREHYWRFVAAAKTLVTGRSAPPDPSARPQVARPVPPRSFRVTPPPPPMRETWPEPPIREEQAARVEEAARPSISYDIELFEALNAEYASKPIVPSPQSYASDAQLDRAKTRLRGVHDAINLQGQRVLEIGCGAGYDLWLLSHTFDADAYGVDLIPWVSWEKLADERTHFEAADITVHNPLPEAFFDRIISFVVWEHVSHPFSALREVYRMLKPGGMAWIYANLWPSAVASHLYRELFFPWPHLLFSEEVIKEFYARRGREAPLLYVNRLSWTHYERYFEILGFEVKMVRFAERPLDKEFYARFEDVLGRYPDFDLTKDFFTVVLQRPLA